LIDPLPVKAEVVATVRVVTLVASTPLIATGIWVLAAWAVGALWWLTVTSPRALVGGFSFPRVSIHWSATDRPVCWLVDCPAWITELSNRYDKGIIAIIRIAKATITSISETPWSVR
jgi:hypothetical protein